MSALHPFCIYIFHYGKYPNISCFITSAIYFTLKRRDLACINSQTVQNNGNQITPLPYFQSALSGWNKCGIGKLWLAVGPCGPMEHGRSFAWPVLVWSTRTQQRSAWLRMQERRWRSRGGMVFIQYAGLQYKQRGDLIRLWKITFKHIQSQRELRISRLLWLSPQWGCIYHVLWYSNLRLKLPIL